MDVVESLRAFLAGDDRDAVEPVPYGWSVVELLPARRSRIRAGRLEVRRWGRRTTTVPLERIGGFAQVSWRLRRREEHPRSEMWALDHDGRPLRSVPWDRRTDAEARAAGCVVRRFAHDVTEDAVRAVWPAR